MSMAVCSVIIPAYNCRRYIGDCLASVQAQSVSDLEILVVDDCSPDDTGDIVKSMAAKDSRIKYIRLPQNSGAAAARNKGIRAATGEWAAFLDSDDMWTPDKLQQQFDFQRQTGAEFLYTGASCIDEAGEALHRQFYVPVRVDYKGLLRGNDIICSSVLAKRSLLLRHPMCRSDLHEDYITWLSLLKDIGEGQGIDEPLTIYRIRSNSKSGSKLHSLTMHWKTLRYLKLLLLKRCGLFCAYGVHGIKRYFG